MLRFLFDFRFAQTICIALLFVCAHATAGEFDDLIGSENSLDFSAAERALFVDAPDRYKKYEIPKSLINSGLYWLDNERMALSTRQYGGWVAQPDEPSRIISYNVRTGEIVDSGYRGKLRCLNHLGDLLIYQPAKNSATYFDPESYQWLAGKWGKPLEKVEYVRTTFVSNYLCRFVPYGPLIFGSPPEQLPPDAAKITPLLPQHGAMKETVTRKDGELEEKLFLISPDGKTTFLRNKRLSHFNFIYQPWNDAYFEAGTSLGEPRTTFLSGEQKIHPLPRLIRFWEKKQGASAGGFSARPGMIWVVQQGSGYWRKQGLYLETGKELIRIEAGNGSSPIKTSPDGCRMFVSLMRGDLFSNRNTYHSAVIDVCEESNK